ADVANSKYSQFPWGIGPPVAAYGTVGYFAIIAFAFARTLPQMADRDKLLLGLNVLLAAIGTVASLSLTYAEAFLIHAWCKWCVGSQIIMLCLLGLTLTEWFTYKSRKVAEQA
ncbi:MAG: vitamin K epoxide reductase family protein, partial [Capsulimonadales bacterium]|nr:vitamin K epoxide reductase family protein [Capsulimonadales bacterium]